VTTAQENEWVEAWIAALSEEVRRKQLPSRLPPTSPAAREIVRKREQELEDDQSLLEVLRRGLDPLKPRHFRGRIATTFRCASRNHELGNIYPTKTHPVFVPTVAALPLKPATDVAYRHDQTQRSRETETWNALNLRLDGVVDADERSRLRNPSRRDGWIRVDRTQAPYILGLEVLSPRWLSKRNYKPPMTEENVAVDLLCRCGTRYAYVQTFRDALVEGTRVISL